jgi:hypothetical protein
VFQGERGSVVVRGVMLQAGRSRVRFPISSLDFFNWPNPSSRIMALGSNQPLTEMNTRNLPGGKWRPAHKADNLTAFCEPIVFKMCEHRRLTNIWAYTACYRGSFTFYVYVFLWFYIKILELYKSRWLSVGLLPVSYALHFWWFYHFRISNFLYFWKKLVFIFVLLFPSLAFCIATLMELKSKTHYNV